ncbi:MAG: hypothetical protein HRF50_14825 [Phycisphaerae bacterium]|jgi:predicted transcriptional regulator
MAKKTAPMTTNDQIRRAMLQYFYNRNKNATSIMGKRGSAVRISDVKAELKEQHALTQQEVQSNLTYLLSQGWVEEKEIKKEVRAKGGTLIPSVTKFYQITAAGIDKIEGPGEFTRDPFHGIRIEATGQNIITVGDGNHVNAVYKDVSEALSGLADQVRACGALKEAEKLSYVADIQSIQTQLAKPEPNRSVLRTLWDGLKQLATVDGVAGAFERAASVLRPLLGGG